MRKVIAFVVVGLLVLSALWFVVPLFSRTLTTSTVPAAPSMSAPSPGQRELYVGTTRLLVEIAATPEAWARGLSHRDALPEDAGMLFAFPSPAPQTFWMKDTQIPLDILWIHDRRVVGITEGLAPEPGVSDDRLQRYLSPVPVEAVLEVNAGWVARHGIQVGDAIGAQPR